MRLLVRFALATLFFVLFIAAFKYVNIRQRFISRIDPKTDGDEVVRILLMSDDSASNLEINANVTLNVVVVLIISLLSIVLLITGIIVVALTLDSSVIDSESGDLDVTAAATMGEDQTTWKSQLLSSTEDRLLPEIRIIANVNKYSVSSISEI
ncbi:unnamed protein product [Litomosoides sigmodontis]|uniref:Uncharacterized protein n=1 Tax=Litomosoides sigmodontis TaxID=42156 RepID=A0A3P7JP47_LITSI|nr:unnamed protein product [Litomosoides sigmodontis]